MSRVGDFGAPELSLREKLIHLNWEMVVMISLIAGIGFAMLFSAANGDLSPWASRQMVRFAVGVVMMLVIAVIDIRFWLKVSYALYGVSFILLATVEVMGSVGMGAQRWLDLKVIQLQPFW